MIDNPLWEGLRAQRTPEPCAVVIFGATGDLTKRKLLPALYQLSLERLLPHAFAVVGFARRDWNGETWRGHISEAVSKFSRTQPTDAKVLASLTQDSDYISSAFDTPDGYRRLAECLDTLDREHGTCGNRLFYLATPPEFFRDIVKNLGAAGLNRGHEAGRGWARIIIEKPFGRDLGSAVELNRFVHNVFRESQLFRIDHYLGKETVQNILIFRFANSIFEPIWDRQYVDHVQITVAETVGVEGRADYYESAGISRDILQNHMLQLLTLIGMEAPAAFDADAVRDEKLKVLRSLRPIEPSAVERQVVRAQYGPGVVNGAPVPGYLEEPKVHPDSTTETFMAVKAFIDTWRWADVPFYLRSGKRLPKRCTEIAIQFKKVPLSLFGQGAMNELEPNVLAMKIQPDEGISLKSNSKQPGPVMTVRPVNLDFRYGTSFGVAAPEAYERLLLDCMLGDSTLFTRADEVEAAWRFVDQIVEGNRASGVTSLPQYGAGTWGPDTAHDFIERDGRRWRRL